MSSTNVTAPVGRRATVRILPVDPTFDEAIRTMVRETLPNGFVVSDDAPSSFRDLCQHLDRAQRMQVWSGASNFTIFGSPEVNFAFRAWHDQCHYTGRYPFTLGGEAETALLQIQQLESRFRDCNHGRRWKALILADVVGQSLFHEVQGQFPENQRRFVNALADLLLEPQAAVPERVPQYVR